MKILRTAVIAGLLLWLMTTAGFAGPIVTGQLVVSPTVASLKEVDGLLASNSTFYLIFEGTFTVSGLKVDVNAPGLYDQTSDLPGTKPTLTGTYQSWIIHSDPVNDGSDHLYLGAVTFDANIVGLMLLSDTLSDADGCHTQSSNPNASGGCNLDPINASFGTGYMRYSDGSLRGLELGLANDLDRIQYISPSTLSITQFDTSNVVDEVRILTQIPTANGGTTAPEPTSLILLGTGLSALGLAAWRKRK